MLRNCRLSADSVCPAISPVRGSFHAAPSSVNNCDIVLAYQLIFAFSSYISPSFRDLLSSVTPLLPLFLKDLIFLNPLRSIELTEQTSTMADKLYIDDTPDEVKNAKVRPSPTL
jgi:hypothetical protein